MGRKKVCPEMLREREQERKETFAKRCKGLFKKAHELAAMCGCELQLSVHAEDGRLYHLHRLRNPLLSSAATPSSSSSSAAPPPRPPKRCSRLYYDHQSHKLQHCRDDYFKYLSSVLRMPPSSSSAAPLDPATQPNPASFPSSTCLCFDCFAGNSPGTPNVPPQPAYGFAPSPAVPTPTSHLCPTPLAVLPPIYFQHQQYLPHPAFTHNSKPEPEEISTDSGAVRGIDNLPPSSCDQGMLESELKTYNNNPSDCTLFVENNNNNNNSMSYDDHKSLCMDAWDFLESNALESNPYM